MYPYVHLSIIYNIQDMDVLAIVLAKCPSTDEWIKTKWRKTNTIWFHAYMENK